MKKIGFFTLSMLLVLSLGCKQTKKENTEQQQVSKELGADTYTLIKDSTKVGFTAYKTTAKVPVKGSFKNIVISNDHVGSTPLEALNGIAFSIPVSSLFTNDATGIRDPKILKFFFGVMTNTELISGVFHAADKKCAIDVTLNGTSVNIPLDYTMDTDTSISFKGVLNLEDVNALDALASINKACKDLHTGADGISKTWSEVALEAQVQFQK